MGYVIVGAIIGAFVGVCFAIAKREGKAKEALEAQLTDEQKERLMNTEVNFVEENAWIQEGGVAKESFIPAFDGTGVDDPEI